MAVKAALLARARRGQTFLRPGGVLGRDPGTGGVVNEDRLLSVVQRLTETLTLGDLDHTLSRITKAAVESLPETDYASITVLHAGGRLEMAAPTEEVLWGLDAAQYELREGPCYEAAEESLHVASPDLACDINPAALSIRMRSRSVGSAIWGRSASCSDIRQRRRSIVRGRSRISAKRSGPAP